MIKKILTRLQKKIFPSKMERLQRYYAQKLKYSDKWAIVEEIKKLAHKQRALTNEMFALQLEFEWKRQQPPEWFDHYIDLYHTWGFAKQNSFWLERGCFNQLAIKKNSKLLELCCGDGFYSSSFYANIASSINAVDFDPKAIKHAQTYNARENVKFSIADIRTAMPEGCFDNIIWDAAIEHFTENEIFDIMRKIQDRLGQYGVLSGHTIIESGQGKQHPEHEYEFKSKDDLLRFLKPYFKHVIVFETIHLQRHNLYFYASDDIIPFADSWQNMVKV